MRTSSTTLGSKSAKTVRGTCLPELVSLKKVSKEWSLISCSSGMRPSGWMPCSRQYYSIQSIQSSMLLLKKKKDKGVQPCLLPIYLQVPSRSWQSGYQPIYIRIHTHTHTHPHALRQSLGSLKRGTIGGGWVVRVDLPGRRED